ncbi:MAG: biopolymer transporter ExbD [Deltaproteobacteria bacterium]|nr:biopolymer transporter ExbD [Deltaproteobacteria bacterium]
MAGLPKDDWTSTEPMSEINIVPLVDVLLVLLVIFMITAPLIVPTLEVRLPKADLSQGADPQQTLIITISQGGEMAVNDKKLGHMTSRDARYKFEAAILRWKGDYPNQAAFVRADKMVRYGAVVRVMAHLNKLGVSNVGLMVEPEGH